MVVRQTMKTADLNLVKFCLFHASFPKTLYIGKKTAFWKQNYPSESQKAQDSRVARVVVDYFGSTLY